MSEDVEDIVELYTADPTDIDEMGPPPEMKIPPIAGTLDVNEMGPQPEMKIPPTAGTLDIDEMDPSENSVPALLVHFLTLTRWVPLKRGNPFPVV